MKNAKQIVVCCNLLTVTKYFKHVSPKKLFKGQKTVELTSLIFAIISLFIFWIIISIPVWIAGKALTGGKASFGSALLATLAGPIVFAIITFVVDLFLGSIIGSSAYIFGYILALIAWVWVYKASFSTGWLKAIAIAILAWIIFIILSIIVGMLFGVTYPAPFFPTI